ncbi:MAG TPA: HupE/UreJ family protein [Polyangiaceae bacterium]|jgi:hypothetical protein
MKRALLVLAAVVLAVAWPGVAAAHVRSVSWSSWTIEGSAATVRVRVLREDLRMDPRLADLPAEPGPEEGRALDEILEHDVRVESAAGPCSVEPGSLQASADAEQVYVVRAWRLRCDGAPVRIVSDLLFDAFASHVHFASLARGDAPVVERLLTADARAWDIGGGAVPTGVAGFVTMGIRHVVTGPDHVLFVLMLLLAATSLRAVAGVVTGFTLGHSATLALAVLGGVRPDVPTVEALVGASIGIVAVENVWLERRDEWMARGLVAAIAAVGLLAAVGQRSGATAFGGLAIFVACYFGLLARARRPERLRWTVAALFGTVHGLAFSGALAEMSLPRASLAGALFGFNVGVEIAQLAVVCLAWPLWRLLARSSMRARGIDLASAAALGAGSFWVVDRVFGGVAGP